MRALILAATLAAGPALAALVMKAPGAEMRLYDSPCVHAGVLGAIKPEHRKNFKKAGGFVRSGEKFYACWIEHEGHAVVVFEDGDQGAWPLARFRDEPGI